MDTPVYNKLQSIMISCNLNASLIDITHNLTKVTVAMNQAEYSIHQT